MVLVLLCLVFCTFEAALDNLSLELVRERLGFHHRPLETVTETGLASVIASIRS